jgi:hypothetical protein
MRAAFCRLEIPLCQPPYSVNQIVVNDEFYPVVILILREKGRRAGGAVTNEAQGRDRQRTRVPISKEIVAESDLAGVVATTGCEEAAAAVAL